jgi:hypothetical protein
MTGGTMCHMLQLPKREQQQHHPLHVLGCYACYNLHASFARCSNMFLFFALNLALLQTAQTYITEHNTPLGACAFCLHNLEQPHQKQQQQSSTGGGTQHAPALLRLPCYHAFHM